MENLNAEQVKKALECCKTGQCHNGCPLLDFCNEQDVLAGSSKLCGDALALINSQEQRIGELEAENERLRAEKETLEIYNKDYKYKNKELTAFNRRWAKECAELQEECEYIKANTVRKMHSEIKERCIKGGIYPAFVASTIDQIAKEMLEDENDVRQN